MRIRGGDFIDASELLEKRERDEVFLSFFFPGLQ